MRKPWKQLTSSQIIILGFALLILAGALLLTLPIATRGPGHASFWDALFTSTSASCVTGLVVQDTGTYWSYFGQAVILCLIQIGGMGIVTFAMAIAIASGRKIGLMSRGVMQDSIDAPQMAGILRLTRFILTFTAAVETAGAVSMMPVFIPRFGVGKGIWYSFFHSISAFCNAGFDLMGVEDQYSSLTAFSDSPIINITIMALIVVGGLGFFCWYDILQNRWHVRHYRMQTKVVLMMTAILIVLPAIYFYMIEYSDFSGSERVFLSLFQSVTTRTAGFNTADLNKLGGTGLMLMILLMLIGGSPGSTAGGMKTTTIAVLFASSFAVFRRKKDVNLFHRRVDEETNKKAGAIMLMYLFLFLLSAIVIFLREHVSMAACLFETASAIGTVGLTLGLTPGLHMLSRTVLVLLMYFGRVGGLTLIFATLSSDSRGAGRNPVEKITVG